MAGYVDATKNASVNAIAALGVYISGHTADPGTTGTSETSGGSYARQATTWGAAAAGVRAGSQISTPIAAGVTLTHWGIWSASSGGTFVGSFALSAPEVFGSAGTWQHTPTITSA